MTTVDRAVPDLGIEIVVSDDLPPDRAFIVAPPLMVPTEDPNMHRIDLRRVAVIATDPLGEGP